MRKDAGVFPEEAVEKGAEGIVRGSIKRGFSLAGTDTRTPPIESGPGRREESLQRTKTIPEAPPRPTEWLAPSPEVL